MSGIEPEVKSFLSRIATSLSVGLLWLLVNSTIGIGFNFAFFENKPTLGNYIFYSWFLLSLFLLIIFYKKKWKL
ncbi:MAG: hypothetical protein ACR2KX_16670 [Chitinophagaceae bacterium]|jgi:hypothetical protein